MLTHLDSFCNFLLLYTLAPFSLHYFPTRRSSDLQVEVTEALNIEAVYSLQPGSLTVNNYVTIGSDWAPEVFTVHVLDRKSTRLNSSHVAISYAVFCLKKNIKLYRDTHIIYVISLL